MRRLAMLACVALGGCSFAFGTAPEAHPSLTNRSPCSESRAPAVIDTIFAGLSTVYLGLGVGLVVACRTGDLSGCDGTEGFPVIVGLAAAIAYGASAVSGYRGARRCRDVHRRQDAWLATHPPVFPGREVGEACYIDQTGVGHCDGGLTCDGGVCVTTTPIDGEGRACGAIPGARRGGVCPAGLHCRDATCVRNEWRAP